VSDVVMEWDSAGKHLYIRDLVSQEDFRTTEQIQIEAWNFSELDVVPASIIIASKWAGAVTLGAFDEDRMIGFVYGFPGYENGKTSIHSHMLAVRPDSRNLNAGFLLKLAQRAETLAHGINEITWTFDPLQSLNAHLNFSRLGVICERYLVNFYGELTSSPLHQGTGTDRLWVRWLLDSDLVKSRIERERVRSLNLQPSPDADGPRGLPAIASGIDDSIPALERGPDPAFLIHAGEGLQRVYDLPDAVSQCLIEMPNNITGLKQTDPELARAWRESVQGAFLYATRAGFIAVDFWRAGPKDNPRWFYLLVRNPDLS
jgi:chorismate synthase